MAQKLVLHDGFYECPDCENVYEIKNADPEEDGYCFSCQDAYNKPVMLKPCK